MKTKYNLSEGSKWKELARQGKLSQKDFDTLKTSSLGKKYLNPRQIMKNKAKGQEIELQKLLKKNPEWKLDIVRDMEYRPRTNISGNNKHITIHLGPTPANYKAINYDGAKRPTALQRARSRAHEIDEAIQALKQKQVTDNDRWWHDEKRIAVKHYKNKPFILTPSMKQNSEIERELKNVKTVEDKKSLSYDASNAVDGYGHEPGVLNREFELRNLLYPSYRTSPNKKLQSFSKGKYTVHRRADEYDDKKIMKRIRQSNKLKKEYNKVLSKRKGIIPALMSKLINNKRLDLTNYYNPQASVRDSDEIEYGKMPTRKQSRMLRDNYRILVNQILGQ